MNRKESKRLAEIVSDEQIKTMLDRAKAEIDDWSKASVANIGLSRGCHWNMFCRKYYDAKSFSTIHKYRLIQEYGEFLPEEFHPKKTSRVKTIPVHHDPIFD